MKFEKLFESINIGNIQIKNRIAMAPMGILGLVNPTDGALTQRAIDYYAERAFGGVGLIITGLTKAEDRIEPRGSLPIINAVSSYGFGELAEAVHYYGGKIFVQLTPGVGRVMAGPLIDMGIQPVSASAIEAFWRPHVTTRALTTEDVEEIVMALGGTAKLLRDLGIDGVELHGHEGYLLDQFTTALWNKRGDKYGGNLQNRLRFPIEILETIKDKAGSDFPVVYRFGLKHYIKKPWVGALKGEIYVEAGRDIDEGLRMAQILEESGFDALHVDAGCYDSWYWPHPPIYQADGCMVEMAEAVKRCVKIPVITVGKHKVPELAEKILREGKADVVALGRALLSDPHWPKKVLEGNVEEIRPCIGCYDGCMGRMAQFKPLSCATNPATGRERLYAIVTTNKPKRLLIVGAGAAGMEAARTAAIRGDAVILYEKNERIGGHLIAGSVPAFKQDIKKLLDWYETQLKKLKVRVELNREITPDFVRKQGPEKVIISTGSKPIIPNLPGIESSHVATCTDLLLGRKKAGDSVVIMGGGLVGCETGLWLSLQGKRVTIVEMLPELAKGIFHSNRTMLLALLAQGNVELMPGATLDEITEEGVKVIDRNFKRSEVRCDTVALALGLEPQRALYESLKGEMAEVYMIGDCKDPANILHAIWDGYAIGRC